MSYSVESISRLLFGQRATYQNPLNLTKQVIFSKLLSCMKSITHNYESCAKFISHITTIMTHVVINKYLLTDDTLLLCYVKYDGSTYLIG